ncbi:MAG: MmcQ/YjbR family DNA-binding protein [Asticcacaulis sp.]|uniref:MmcQ/YjbR family DNA-binding protein n=1 Tax=Asticcacaulis sp. TaxID=1872648 RepID=UPI003F7C943B
MLTQDRLRAMALELPGTEPGTSYGYPAVKLGKKVIVVWSPKWNAPVFGMDFETRDFFMEADPETFFTTDHHRNWPCVLARPETVSEDWVRLRLIEAWRKAAPKTLQKAHPELLI